MVEDTPDVEKGREEEEEEEDCDDCLSIAHLSFQCIAIAVLLVVFAKMVLDDDAR